MDSPTTVWLVIAALLVCIEIMTQMVWTLCLAVGCVGALVASICGADTAWQIATMAITSVIAYIAMMPWLKRWHDRQQHKTRHKALTGMDALPGRTGIVTTDIVPGSPGRVRIDGDSWQAIAPGNDDTIPSGIEVIVVNYDGNILSVQIKQA